MIVSIITFHLKPSFLPHEKRPQNYFLFLTLPFFSFYGGKKRPFSDMTFFFGPLATKSSDIDTKNDRRETKLSIRRLFRLLWTERIIGASLNKT